MKLNQKPGYYDALIEWCDIRCSNTHVLKHEDGTQHCHDNGRQVDFHDGKTKVICLKCPYNTEWKWKLKAFGGK